MSLTNTQLAVRYDDISTRIKELEQEKKAIQEQILDYPEWDQDRIDLDNGWHWTRYVTERKSYPVELVLKHFGAEAKNYLKVDKTKVDLYLVEQTVNKRSAKWTAIMGQFMRAAKLDSTSVSVKLGKK